MTSKHALIIVCLSAALAVMVTPVTASTLVLGWTAPIRNVDGSPVQDLAGFNVYMRSDTDFVAGYDIAAMIREDVSSTPSPGEAYTLTLTVRETVWLAVTAIDLAGNESAFSDALHYIPAPEVPPHASVPLAPMDTVESTRRPTFRWAEVESAEWYRIAVSRDGQNYHSQWIKAATSWTPDWDFAPGEYTWSVQTWNAFGFGAWSESMIFVIPSRVPGLITLYSPAGDVDTNAPAFRWSGDDKAAWYRLYVQRGGKKAISRWIESATAYTPAKTELLRYGYYTWWIQGWGLDGFGPWSEAKEFEYGITQPISPAGPTGLRHPDFQWTQVRDADWYRVWIGREGKEYHAFWVENLNTRTPAAEFPYGNYTWYVQAWNPTGTGPWSQGMDFSVLE